MCLKRVEKKKLWGRHSKDISWNTLAKQLFNSFRKCRSSHRRCSIKKLFLKNSNIYRKYFNSEYCEIFKSTYFEEHLRTAASEKMLIWNDETKQKQKLLIRNFNFILKNQVKMFVFNSWEKQVKIFVFILRLVSFGVCSQITVFWIFLWCGEK